VTLMYAGGMRIVLTGGGTGGHLIPFGPIVDGLRIIHQEQNKDLPLWIERNKLDIYFLGVLDDKSREFFKKNDIKPIHIPAAKLRRYPSPRTVTDMLIRMPVGLIKSLWYMWSIMPDVVISKGGYGSVPVGLAAAFYRVPVLLHESDAVSGLANRMMAGLASVMTVGFAATRHESGVAQSKTIVTGTPVRKRLFVGSRDEAKTYFGFDPDESVLLVIGGSQGAAEINELMLEVLPSLIEDMGIIHLTGEKHINEIKESAKKLLVSSSRSDMYKPYGYLTEDIGQALIAADVVVTRAGATSLAEIAHLNKPTIVIPLATAAQDHQRENAKVFDLAQAVRVITPENLGRALFEQNVRDIMNSDKIRSTLAGNIGRLKHPHAARDIADLAFKLARGLQPVQPRHEVTDKSGQEDRHDSKKNKKASR